MCVGPLLKTLGCSETQSEVSYQETPETLHKTNANNIDVANLSDKQRKREAIEKPGAQLQPLQVRSLIAPHSAVASAGAAGASPGVSAGAPEDSGAASAAASVPAPAAAASVGDSAGASAGASSAGASAAASVAGAPGASADGASAAGESAAGASAAGASAAGVSADGSAAAGAQQMPLHLPQQALKAQMAPLEASLVLCSKGLAVPLVACLFLLLRHLWQVLQLVRQPRTSVSLKKHERIAIPNWFSCKICKSP